MIRQKSRVMIIQLYRLLLYRPVIIQVGHKNERLPLHYHCLSAYSSKNKPYREMRGEKKCTVTFSSAFCHFQHLYQGSFQKPFWDLWTCMWTRKQTPFNFFFPSVRILHGSLRRTYLFSPIWTGSCVDATDENSRSFSWFQLVLAKVLNLAVKRQTLLANIPARTPDSTGEVMSQRYVQFLKAFFHLHSTVLTGGDFTFTAITCASAPLQAHHPNPFSN